MDASKKLYFLTYAIQERGNHAYITHARAVRGDGRGREWDGDDLAGVILQELTNAGAALVYVWDLSIFGTFCDYYALSRGLPHFSEAKKRTLGRAKVVAEPCWNALYSGAHGCLDFKLTLARTAKTHDYGSGNIGGLHTVEYRGARPLWGKGELKKVCDDLGIPTTDEAAAGLATVKAFATHFNNLCDEDFFARAYKNIYTIGGAAKAYYLRIKYGAGKDIRAYQKEFKQSEKFDEWARECRLLLGGMCFFPDAKRGELFNGKIVKYDKNSLYPYIFRTAPALGFPQKSDYAEFRRDRSGEYVYILFVKNTLLMRRKGAPNCFASPFTHTTGGAVEIPQLWAVFGELWDALGLFYQREEFDIVHVFKCKKISDAAARDYVDTLYKQKLDAKNSDNATLYMLTKIYLNAICGKFAQTTIFREYLPEYSEEIDSVIFKEGQTINNWERGHFHFLRGAYIYTLARVEVMRDMARIFAASDAQKEHFYTDTDSIITTAKLPADMVDAVRLGAYKVEEQYNAFGAVAQKVYYGRTTDGRDTLTAAGIQKGAILAQIAEAYGADLTAPEIWQILTAGTAWDTYIYIRVSGGAVRRRVSVKFDDINISKLL